MLEAYKEGEPKTEDISTIVREMYGNHLKKASIVSYVSVYKKYIRENMLNPEFPAPQIGALSTEADAVHSKEGDVVEGDIEAIVVKSPQKAINRLHKLKPDDPLSIEEVVKIWDLLEDKFVFKDVKRNLPAGIMQSTARIDAANYAIKVFLAIAEFGCEEPELGLFKKVGRETNLKTKE